ncbi:hypothetical protein SDC9_205478 [bioreactor metagenome]|uniref:Uncharacterized protein n=1 Tax=bioreactor metagenome TaxID=1076179 RepID=A0A645JBM4_9ZZZZ
MCACGKAAQNPAFPDQIAEHQEADQFSALRRNGSRHHRNKDGEQNAGGVGNRLGVIGHTDHPLFFRGTKANHRRLNDGHQGHIAIGRHHNRPLIGGLKIVGYIYAGGAIRRANDGDAGRILKLEPY